MCLAAVPMACIEIDPSYGAGGSSGASPPASSGSGSSTGTRPGSTSEGPVGPVPDLGGDGSSGGPVTGTNLAFVTSALVTGDLGGLVGADALCNSLADDAGLGGTYVAWLGDSTTHAITRLGSANGWVGTDGRVFARDQGALLSDPRAYPLLRTETGEIAVATFAFVYTGTDRAGMSVAEHCEDWSSGVQGVSGGFGYNDSGTSSWTEAGLLDCAGEARLYCLGVDFNAPVELPLPPPNARIAFVSDGQLAGDAGRVVADALCASEASAAGLDGTFIALMAVAGETLWARHDLTGPPWVRPDGVNLFPSELPIDQWGETLNAPLILDAQGNISSTALLWTGVGTVTEVASAVSTCNDWNDTTAERTNSGSTVFADWLSTLADAVCDVTGSVACVQQ